MKYPILRPIQIPMENLSFLMRIWTWLFCVRKWELVYGWSFKTKIDGKKREIYIPKGFIFDGASIPRWLWWLLQPMGILLIPGLIHDYAYRHRCLKDTKGGIKFSDDRRYWDKVFREVSIDVNRCKFISYAAWLALWIFGGFAWRKNRKLEAESINNDWQKLREVQVSREWKYLADKYKKK